jgi:hypothetical protein
MVRRHPRGPPSIKLMRPTVKKRRVILQSTSLLRLNPIFLSVGYGDITVSLLSYPLEAILLIKQLAKASHSLASILRFEEGDTDPNLGGIKRLESPGLRLSAMHERPSLLCVVSSLPFSAQLKLIIQGPQGNFLHHLHRLTRKFTLNCERFDEEGYILLWPEFNNRSDINVPRFRDQFNRFRAFQREWASRGGIWSRGHRRERIDIAYEAFINRQDYASRILPLPGGFDFGFAFQ